MKLSRYQMVRLRIGILAASAVVLAMVNTTAQRQQPSGAPVTVGTSGSEESTAHAFLKDAMGRQIGRARLEETPNGVLVRLTLTDAPAGTHAFHIHDAGKCQPSFDSAGGHFNPTHASHGYKDATGPHLGDLPNVHVPSIGGLDVEILAPGTMIAGGQRSLLDGDGTALVLHRGANDYQTEPAGDSGSRIGCGVITH